MEDYRGLIREIRERYGISRKSYALLLGISEPSVVRYEQGQKPTQSNGRLIELSRDPAFMRRCFEEAAQFLPAAQRRRMAERLLDESDNPTLADNGFAVRDHRRIAAAMNYLAGKCSAPYFTRVIKGCFIADFLHFEATGVSLLGLAYAHAPHGPVIDGHSTLRQRLEHEDLISLSDDGWGLLFVAPQDAEDADTLLSESDRLFLDVAARFVDSFTSIKNLSEATHELPCWKSTMEGELIPYRRNAEVTQLVESQLYEPNNELASRLRTARNADSAGQAHATVAGYFDALGL